jgi:argininosuccinate lyase
VREAEARGATLSALPYEAFRAANAAFGEDTLDVFDFARSAAVRRVSGATAPAAVREQIEQARTCLAQK